MTRRAFLRTAAGRLVAAPAIVRASSLMPVRPVVDMRDIVFPPLLLTCDQATEAMLKLWHEETERAVREAVLYGTGWLADQVAPRVIPNGGIDRLVFRRHLPLRLTQRPNPSET